MRYEYNFQWMKTGAHELWIEFPVNDKQKLSTFCTKPTMQNFEKFFFKKQNARFPQISEDLFFFYFNQTVLKSKYFVNFYVLFKNLFKKYFNENFQKIMLIMLTKVHMS